uniref:DUF554 domain-containing protein n=1 Tax=Anaerostipes caccae TaxID=105841 RepID=UPI003AB83ACE
MPGLGTIINVSLILLGGCFGLLFGDRLSEGSRDSLMKVNGVAVLFMGLSGALSKIFVLENSELTTQGTVMMTVSLAAGTVIGELCCIDDQIERFGHWLKYKSGSAKDAQFVDGFVTAAFSVCIGAMAVIGSIQDGISGNHSILIAKGVLDFVIILLLTASMGKGCIFSAVPVAVFQGTITVSASFLALLITDGAMNNISLVGSVLIFCVGINLVWNLKIKVANMLPSLMIAAAWSYIF